MTLNLQAKDSYHVFDSYGMLIIPSDQSWEKRSWWKKFWDWILKREWISTWSNKSWKDSLGRTVLAWIAYGRPKELEHAIGRCLVMNTKTIKWELYRHPGHKELSSRDHWSYFLIIMRLSSNDWYFNQFLIPDIPRMRGMNLWMKSLTGNKRAEYLYYLIYIPGALIGNIWLRICRCVGRIGPERDNNWWIGRSIVKKLRVYIPGGITNGLELQNGRTKWQKLWGRIISISIPAYAFHNKAWQIHVMPDSKRKEQLKRILLKRVGKSNIMLRLLFGDTTVTQEEVDSYPHLTGYRPGAYLNTTRRTIRKLTTEEAEWNTFEKQLIIWLYGIE